MRSVTSLMAMIGAVHVPRRNFAPSLNGQKAQAYEEEEVGCLLLELARAGGQHLTAKLGLFQRLQKKLFACLETRGSRRLRRLA